MTAEGEFALVREHLEAALTKPSIGWIAFGDHEVYNLLADTAARQRDESALQKYAPLAEEAAIRYNHRLNQAIAHRAWGVGYRLAGDYEDAELCFKQALDIFNDMNTTQQIGRTLSELGELDVARNNPAAARELFSQALNAFERISAAPDAMRVRERLAAL